MYRVDVSVQCLRRYYAETIDFRKKYINCRFCFLILFCETCFFCKMQTKAVIIKKLLLDDMFSIWRQEWPLPIRGGKVEIGKKHVIIYKNCQFSKLPENFPVSLYYFSQIMGLIRGLGA